MTREAIMALTQRSEVVQAPRGTPCSVGAVYESVSHDKAELAELNAILYEEGNSQAQVYTYLTQGGYKIGGQTPNRHRGKHCRCFTEAPFNFCATCRRDLPSCVC